jgi:hypothetical protein
LLDPDPLATIEALAPYVVNTHLKNMAVAPYEEGFLMSEVLLGEGYLDLPRAIRSIQHARPRSRWALEMITRDPLKVPCLTDQYWATFPDRSGLALARTLRFVHTNKSAKPLPGISHLTREDQLKLENQNVIACLQYARETLGL